MYRTKYGAKEQEAAQPDVDGKPAKYGLLSNPNGDCVLLKRDKIYTTEALVLFDLRRLVRSVLILHGCVFGIFMIVVAVIWSQLAHYDLLTRSNMNQLNANVLTILQNVNTLTTQSVPIVENTALATNLTTSAIFALLNSSSLLHAPGRHLLSVTTETAALEDYKTRLMIYTQVKHLMTETRSKLHDFNATSLSASVNYAVYSFGDLLQWLMHGVNYRELDVLYRRTLGDLEHASNFAVLLSSVFGVTVAAANITTPSVMGLINTTRNMFV